MKTRWFITTVLVLFISINGFSQIAGKIPSYIQAKADSLLIERIGADNFSRLSMDCHESGPFLNSSVWEICPDTTKKLNKKQQRYIEAIWLRNKVRFYWFCYDFKVKEDITYKFDFMIDTLGKLCRDRDFELPSYSQHPKYFQKIISKERAIYLADSAGLDKGIGDWKVELKYHEETGQFAWEVESIIEHSEHSGTESKIAIVICTTEEIRFRKERSFVIH